MTIERTYEELFYTTKNYEMSFLYETEAMSYGSFYHESRYEEGCFVREYDDQLDIERYINVNVFGRVA